MSTPAARFLAALAVAGLLAAPADARRARRDSTSPAARGTTVSTVVATSEVDRLLADHPPVGAPLDPLEGLPALPDSAPMAGHEGPAGLGTAFSGSGSTSAWSEASSPLSRLQAAAEPFLGAPYRAGGNGEPGFDCSGFVRKMLSLFGQTLSGRSSGAYWTQGDPVPEEDLQPGDLVFFSDNSRHIGHVGIYLSGGDFVHASVGKGVVVSNIAERWYRIRYKGGRRLDGFRQALLGLVP